MKRVIALGKKYFYIVVLLGVFLVLGLFCPPVLYLNDDITMRSILSGSYTGSPDGHAVYMQYPLTALLAALYGMFPAVSWLELFFMLCIWGSMLLLAKEFYSKIAGIVFVVAFCFPLYIYMHYTVVAALVAGTAVFLSCRGKHPRGSIFLLWIAYMIRSQVGLLSLPFVAAALVWRALNLQEKLRTQLLGIGKCVGMLAIGLGIISGINAFCYSSQDWQEYLEYNEARTQLYDYTDYTSTDRYAENYAAYGLTQEQSNILFNYYLMLDNAIDREIIQGLADTITDGMWSDMGAGAVLKNCLEKYYYQVRFRDFPYNIVWVAAYVLLFLGMIMQKKWWQTGFLVTLGAGRSLVWLYLIWKGRYPERVVLSLYIIELLLLLAVGIQLVQYWKKEAVTGGEKVLFGLRRPFLGKLVTIGFVIVCLCFGTYRGKNTWQETQACVKLQQGWMPLKEYCQANPEKNFFVDVFSTTTYADIDYTADFSNMMMIGGWLSGSPLAKGRMEQFGGKDAAEVLYYNKDARLVADISRDMTWLEEYLQERFGDCELVVSNVIYCDWRAIMEYEVR